MDLSCPIYLGIITRYLLQGIICNFANKFLQYHHLICTLGKFKNYILMLFMFYCYYNKKAFYQSEKKIIKMLFHEFKTSHENRIYEYWRYFEWYTRFTTVSLNQTFDLEDNIVFPAWQVFNSDDFSNASGCNKCASHFSW